MADKNKGVRGLIEVSNNRGHLEISNALSVISVILKSGNKSLNFKVTEMEDFGAFQRFNLLAKFMEKIKDHENMVKIMEFLEEMEKED